METVPSPNGDNGLAETRDAKGRFLPGTPGIASPRPNLCCNSAEFWNNTAASYMGNPD